MSLHFREQSEGDNWGESFFSAMDQANQAEAMAMPTRTGLRNRRTGGGGSPSTTHRSFRRESLQQSKALHPQPVVELHIVLPNRWLVLAAYAVLNAMLWMLRRCPPYVFVGTVVAINLVLTYWGYCHRHVRTSSHRHSSGMCWVCIKASFVPCSTHVAMVWSPRSARDRGLHPPSPPFWNYWSLPKG